MSKLVKVNKFDLDSVKKLYEFMVINNPNWQENRKLMIKIGLKQPVNNEDKLSGFALFYETVSEQSLGIEGQYLYLEENDPIVSLLVTYYEKANCVDVSYITRKDQMHKGYATAALGEISEYIFNNTNVEYIKLAIISMSSPFSKNVAIKNGFVEISQNEYRKNNPHYQNKF